MYCPNKTVYDHRKYCRHEANSYGTFTLDNICDRKGDDMALVLIAACCCCFRALQKTFHNWIAFIVVGSGGTINLCLSISVCRNKRNTGPKFCYLLYIHALRLLLSLTHNWSWVLTAPNTQDKLSPSKNLVISTITHSERSTVFVSRYNLKTTYRGDRFTSLKCWCILGDSQEHSFFLFDWVRLKWQIIVLYLQIVTARIANRVCLTTILDSLKTSFWVWKFEFNYPRTVSWLFKIKDHHTYEVE